MVPLEFGRRLELDVVDGEFDLHALGVADLIARRLHRDVGEVLGGDLPQHQRRHTELRGGLVLDLAGHRFGDLVVRFVADVQLGSDQPGDDQRNHDDAGPARWRAGRAGCVVSFSPVPAPRPGSRRPIRGTRGRVGRRGVSGSLRRRRWPRPAARSVLVWHLGGLSRRLLPGTAPGLIAGSHPLGRCLRLAERTLVAGTPPRRRAFVRWSLRVRHPTRFCPINLSKA